MSVMVALLPCTAPALGTNNRMNLTRKFVINRDAGHIPTCRSPPNINVRIGLRAL
jgi:hypothetical protein